MKHAKYLIILAMLVSVFFVLPVSTIYAATVETPALIQEVAEEKYAEPFDFEKLIKVGYYPTFTDFANDLNSLNNRGYGVEIFDKIQEVSDLEFEYIPISGDPTVALNNGEIDLLAFRTKTEKKAEQVLYSEIQYGKTYMALLSKDMDFLYGDFEGIDGKTVATFEDNIGNERLDFYCEHLGFTVEYIYGQTHNYMDLEADFYLGFSGQRNITQLNNVLDVGVYSLYVNSTFENKELMDKLDAIFYDIAATEGNYFLELEEKYLAKNVEITHRGLLPDEREVLKERPLEVGYIADYAPISFMNEQGEADGAMVETLNYFAERYDFEVHFHPYSLNDPPQEHKDYDILVSIYGDGVYDNEHYEPTEPYYLIPMYAQVNLDHVKTTSLDEVMSASPTIGVLPYQTVDFLPFSEEFPGAEIVFYEDWYNLLDDFEAGAIEMMMCTETATTFAELYFDDMNRATIHTDTEIPMQYYINKDIAQEYIPIFNVMIDRIPESEYAAILEANANKFLPTQDLSFLEFVAEYWYYFSMLLIIILAGFLALHAFGQVKKKQALIESYNTEPLTGFMAPQYFRQNVYEILKTAKPNEYELIAFDMDMFKNINTYFSTDKGTQVILAISDAMKKVFSDKKVLICRGTAEQFLLFRRVNAGGTMCDVYNKFILPAVREHIVARYNISMSFGNVIINDPQEKITTIIGHAYAARKAGKNLHKTTFITFDDNMRREYENKSTITFRMEQAILDKEFYVEYQPKINFETLRVDGVEALVRWQPKLGGKIFPDEFIPIFEENGFISNLDLYVLGAVCEFIKLNKTKIDIPRISVNLSAHTIHADDIVERICNEIEIHGILPETIEFELTESAIEVNPEQFLDVVKRLKNHGFAISIDDFGAGVSSLNRLSAVEADVLKLDKVFFNLKDQGTKSSTVVSDIIAMAKHLDMKVVAEGVETAAQATWLKGVGCDYAQGYYFARPMSEHDFESLLLSKKAFEIE